MGLLIGYWEQIQCYVPSKRPSYRQSVGMHMYSSFVPDMYFFWSYITENNDLPVSHPIVQDGDHDLDTRWLLYKMRIMTLINLLILLKELP